MDDRFEDRATAGRLWRDLKVRMDDRQAAYRWGWLRGTPVECPPAREDEGLAPDLDLACELYLTCEEGLRSEIRALFGAWTAVRGCMLGQAWSYARRLSETCEARWLRLGLAAVSIDDNGTDFRDGYVTLGGLYVCAVRCGLEPGPYLEEAASLSSAVPTIERFSMRDFLLRFERSAYFEESVAPRLG